MSARRLLFFILLLAPVTAQATPEIQHWQTRNGTRVYFVESHELPMVQLSLVFDAGSARDPDGRYGLALMTNHLLKEGTDSISTDQVAERFERLGAEFSTDSGRDMASMSLRSLSADDKLGPAVDLFAQLAAKAAFPEKSLAREIQRLLVGFRHKQQSPGDLASDLLMKTLYGNHPYAHPNEGDPGHAKRITRDDLKAFHQQYYVGRNAVLAIIGALSKREAKKLAERITGGLAEGKAAPALPEASADVKAQTQRLKFPSTQSHLLIGQVGMHRKDPDYFTLYLGNYILGGGGLVSRLSTEVREKKGLAYSVYSYFWPMAQDGPFIMGLQTENRHVEQARKIVNRVLKEYIDKGPTPEELEAAKRHITGGFALRIDNNKKIAGYLAVIGFYRLPLTYLEEFPQRIEAITAREIQDAFRRRVRPANQVTVIVGG